MARRTAQAQRAYRDKKRGKPPRPYGVKPVIEQQVTYTIPIQYLYNKAALRANRLQTPNWMEQTPLGDMPIRIDPVMFRHTTNPITENHPTWICLAGLRYELQRWDVLDEKFYRWGVVDGNGRVYTKIYILANGRFGTRYSLNLAFQTQNMPKEKRLVKRKAKLIAKIRGEDTLDIDYVKSHPSYVPERRKNKEKGKSGL